MLFYGYVMAQGLSVKDSAKAVLTNRNFMQEILWRSRRPTLRVERNMRIYMGFEEGELR